MSGEIDRARAEGFAAGLERAKVIAKSQVPDVDDTGNGDEYRRGQKRGAIDCVSLIDREIRALYTAALQAPARLDADKTAQPLTEIRAVVPGGYRGVQPYGVEQYVYRETNTTNAPPRTEEQIRAEERARERWRCIDVLSTTCDRTARKWITVEQGIARLKAVGPAPVDDTAARRDAYPLTTETERTLAARLAAAEARVRDLAERIRAAHASACRADEDHGPEGNLSCMVNAITSLKIDTAETDGALKAAEARVRECEAALRSAAKLCRCGGTGRYEPTCYRCRDSTDDHECPDDRDCENRACIEVRAALAKKEGT